MPTHLSAEEQRRYARHLVLPEMGEAGQLRLKAAHALVVGIGGLGSVAAGYLAAMGVGHLTLIDGDRVELSNLQRQILFETLDIGHAKVTAAANRMEEINPHVQVTAHHAMLDATRAAEYLAKVDLVLDCTDNFPSRIALHRACMMAGKPLIYAAMSGFEGMMTSFTPYLGAAHPCLHCLMPEMPQFSADCKQDGVIGALAGVMGSMQAMEAVKYLASIGQTLSGTLLRYHALTATWQKSTLKRDPACPCCG